MLSDLVWLNSRFAIGSWDNLTHAVGFVSHVGMTVGVTRR